MATSIPPCPTVLKTIQPYLNIAAEHTERDPIITYWCRVYALQVGLQTDRSSKEAKMFLSSLMDWLEEAKQTHKNNEAVTNEMAAQAYIENYALKLFNWADGMDRACNFNKNVIKAFYTASILMDVLTTFGQLGDDIVQNRKYAKWKASYIFNCLKNGQTPVPGPTAEKTEEEKELDELLTNTNPPKKDNVSPPAPPPSNNSPVLGNSANNFDYGFINPASPSKLNAPDSGTSQNPYPFPAVESPATVVPSTIVQTEDGAKLNPQHIMKAQKFCKFASSALNYDDVPEAISNLQKALEVLKTGNLNI